jgi:alcohol dehydrogenase class IV
MSSRYLIPKLAILDPDLTKSLPKHLTAATGIDALSHCIEGFFSKKEIPLGKNLALEGIRLATKHLRNATINQDDENARAQMMLSAFCGGISIGMGLGPAHAIAITCSDQGFHHGVLSGIGLIETLQTTCAQIPDKAKEVAQAMGLKPDITLAQGLKKLMRELELPCNLFELGYKTKDLSNLAVLAHKSHFNIFAPYHPTISEYTVMLKKSLNID